MFIYKKTMPVYTREKFNTDGFTRGTKIYLHCACVSKVTLLVKRAHLFEMLYISIHL